FGRPSTKPARRVGERVSDFGFDQQGQGNWENYPDWVRNIYLIELPARGLARVNGSDIERFYYNEDFVEKDGNDVVCEIFIPVRPV
ncbi:hypothetical protein ACOS7P_23430, partial [Escherichia coli]